MIKRVFFLIGLLCLPLSLATGKELPWKPLWDKGAPGLSPKTKEDVQLDNGEHITRISTPSYQLWLPKKKSKTPRPALCVFPGGGYSILAIKKEGQRIAQWAAENGMVGIVVKYRVSNNREDNLGFPTPLTDARRAVRLARKNATLWNIDPDKIGVAGFSAGGHLAAATATTWNKPIEGETSDEIDAVSAKPNFAILVYPVISLDQPYGHGGTKSTLLRNDKENKLLDFCTPTKQLSQDTPPLFLAHAQDDPVSCLNSLDMARAAKEKNIPVELHLYGKGGHGFGMNKRGLPIDSWPDRALEWLRSIDILKKDA